MMNIGWVFLALGCLVTGCYQAHSGDELRTVPVTNNPNLVPGYDPMSRFTSVNP